MQRQRCAIDFFCENIDIDPRTFSNNTDMSQQTSLNNILNPVESSLASSTVSSDEASSVNLHTVLGSRSEERQLEPIDIPNLLFPERVGIGNSGNQVRSGHLLLRGSSSNHAPQNLNPNSGCLADGGHTCHYQRGVAGSESINLDGKEIERASSSGVSGDIGTSSRNSGFIVEEIDGGSGSSLGGWGLSCKRKALEGTSAHSYAGGSSTCFPQAENDVWRAASIHHSTSSNLLSTPSRSSPSVSIPEQVNYRNGFGMRGVASDAYHSSSDSGYVDPQRNIGRRVNAGHQQEAVPFTLPTTGGTAHSNYWSLDLRSTSTASNSSTSQGQSYNINASASSRNAYASPWNGSSFLRSGTPSTSIDPGERIAAVGGEVNIRSSPRNNIDHPMFVPLTDPAGWSLSFGRLSTSGNAHSSRITPSSIHPLPPPTWFPLHDPTAHNQQRSTEFAPWSLFPSIDSESGGHNSHFPSLSSGPSGPSASPQETVPSASSSQGQNQSLPRSAFLMDGRGDSVLGMPRSLRALAADIEGRHRLISEIRQVLNAMRRGENLRVEDYMLFDPFIYQGMAEVHDRHRDMRLDVDNMSYEELLALEERIGDVSTGLTEETIVKLMKQKKYLALSMESQADLEPCCICQEEYVNGEDLGMLECGHDFHSGCIKQWLMHKNLCPICKMTALPT
ncbi:hypothetical protein K2173_002422 [Erythroxylum novogranatense]|uniref:RING-type E3 ubiquitin transferase n=1 Tax=Erythroxylum novogranatense TaxID=1862640 RepID=A0AAV8TB85_9ROSI|nr:hypothetical protein K2173_002422 [Erythroxylum novogranatense]